ncbi:hypothetical protein ORV05_11275 [Amycolatopsis cynarae]|uniref:Uncharacterized protein n=1 Tax=Amycolatopsis cynarae TaxID=2995223 RepID=A0ABY7B9H2_9PSEU|nr:hypothetical protein [Amycolatopsis sp. HUAS 11-8]WAL68313.1 hypothetical protein ORV05_11275 [Amycolatopsis sp. HUAS 11-8]
MKRSPLPRFRPPGGAATPVTAAELGTLLALLRAMRPRPVSVVIGAAADEVSRANAARIERAWTERGGLSFGIVAWPEEAASWLRPARRFTAPAPDAWIVTATPPGWAGMGRRLAFSTGWSPRRTVATAALAEPALIASAGVDTFDGLRGAHPDGRWWEFSRTVLVDGAAPLRTLSPTSE